MGQINPWQCVGYVTLLSIMGLQLHEPLKTANLFTVTMATMALYTANLSMQLKTKDLHSNVAHL